MTPLVWLAAGAVLFALGMVGVRWLAEHVPLTWHQDRRAQIAIEARYLPAIASHAAATGVPRAHVVPGVVLERRNLQ